MVIHNLITYTTINFWRKFMKKKIYLLVLLLMLFIPTFTTPIQIKQPEARFENTKVEPKPNSSSIPFIYGMKGNPYTLDPIDCWDRRSEKIIDQVAETLFTYNYSDPDLPLIPLLATDVSDISGGGLNYTIDLRENVIFHDGTEFNATAAKWNFDRMGYRWNLTGDLPPAEIEGYPSSLFYFEDGETPIWDHTEIVGEYSIKFVLNAPFVPLLDLLTYTAAAMVSPTSFDWDYTAPLLTVAAGEGDLVGTGPFVFKYYDIGVEAKFYAFENYWREPANISELIFSYSDSMSLAIDLLEGSVHFIDQIPQSLFPTLLADPNITVLDEGKTDAGIAYFTYNNNYINQTWRKALSYAINYTYIIKELLADTAVRVKSPILEGILYSNYGFNYPEFNITKARMEMQALDPATFGGLPITPGPATDAAWQAVASGWDISNWHATATPYYLKMWVYAPSSGYATYAELMGEWAALIGIRVEPEVTEWDHYIAQWAIDPDWLDLWVICWCPDYINALNMLAPIMHPESIFNSGQNDDAIINGWLDEASTTTNPVEYNTLISNIQHRFVEVLASHIPFSYDKLDYLIKTGWKGCDYNAMRSIHYWQMYWDPD